MIRFLFLLLYLFLSIPVFAQPCAILIGNGVYPAKSPGKNDLGPLSNPVNDANDMAKLLQNNGVVLVDHEGKNRPLLNANKQQMDAAVDKFIAKLPGCSAALFYYSGHGVYLRDLKREHESANYLMPVGESFRAADPAKIKYNAVNAHAIKERIQNSGVKNRLMILDACRDRLVLEESKGFSGGEEFRPMGAVQGMMVVYATLHSYSAFGDKERRNSVFTGYLLSALQQGGDITRAIAKAIDGVEQENKQLPPEKRQHPWPEGLLLEEFCLVNCETPPPPPPLRNELIISTQPPQARVWIGGKDFGAAPVTVTVQPGSHYALRIEKPGYVTVEETILYHGGIQHQGFSLVENKLPFQLKLKDGSLGPKMVVIPKGSFRMGDIQGGGDSDEKPVHKVTINYDFAMSQYEVTFAEYDKFCEATGRKKPSDSGWGRDNRPVINVSWHDAKAYATWLSEQTGHECRLPTEAEWEYAARAGTETKYWWGNEVGKNNANCDGCGSQWDNKQTAPVGSFKANPFGLYDMNGNVWEWCEDSWHNNYNGAPTDGSAWKKSNENRSLLRGGSWSFNAYRCRSAYRVGDNRGSWYYDNGVRFVCSVRA